MELKVTFWRISIAMLKCFLTGIWEQINLTRIDIRSYLRFENSSLDNDLEWEIMERGSSVKNLLRGTSLVAQWLLRIRLPVQRTWVRALVREDPTCCGATKPVCHNYWACALEPASHNYWAYVPQLLKPIRLEPVLRNKRSHHNEKPMHCNSRPCSPQLEKAGVQQRRPKAAKS